jgi:hypothetical protein
MKLVSVIIHLMGHCIAKEKTTRTEEKEETGLPSKPNTSAIQPPLNNGSAILQVKKVSAPRVDIS